LSSLALKKSISIAQEKKWIERGWPFLLALLLLFFVMIPLAMMLFVVLMTGSKTKEESMMQAEVTEGFPAYARQYLDIYLDAGKKYNVPWEVLAAINKVETDFGRNLSTSHTGARGWMQFQPCTWVGWNGNHCTRLGDLTKNIDITDPKNIKKYGGYGVDANGDGKADPYDPVDAIHTAAKYLAANHKSGEDWFAPKGAVWYYNHDYTHYVLKVKHYAEQFAKAPSQIQGSGQFVFPVPGGQITSEYGLRFHPIRKTYRMHEGVDIGKGMGAPIYAVDDGQVVESRKASGYGWIIVIDHGNNLRTLYAHMYEKDVKVKVGQSVKKGQLIALMGSNGDSTAPHLHFEVLKNGVPTNPMPFLKR